MTDLFSSELTVNSRSVNVQKIVHFLILRKKLVSYFASIKTEGCNNNYQL